MRFRIEKESLLDGLAKTAPITERKSNLPILSHVLMEAGPANLVLTATDLSVGLRISCMYESAEEGAMAVPGKKLLEIVRELAPGMVEVGLNPNGRIGIASDKSSFELAGMDPADYPAWASFEEVESARIPAERLLDMIDKTVFASSNDEARFNLNGVLFEQDDDNIKLVATDGHRLALIKEPVTMTIPSKKVVVAKKSLQELKRMLEGLKEEISLGFEPKNMFVKSDRFMMTVRLTEGDYPDYRKVIPEPGDKLLRADRAKLLQTLKRVGILTSDRNRGVNVEVKTGEMEIMAVHPDLGTARDVVEVDYEGDSFSMIVNVAYLMDSLTAVDGDTVRFEFHNEGEPIIVTPEPKSAYFNLVMPMRK